MFQVTPRRDPWERQATAWVVAYRLAVVLLLVLALAEARAAHQEAHAAATTAAANRSTLKDIWEAVDDLSHR